MSRTLCIGILSYTNEHKRKESTNIGDNIQSLAQIAMWCRILPAKSNYAFASTKLLDVFKLVRKGLSRRKRRHACNIEQVLIKQATSYDTIRVIEVHRDQLSKTTETVVVIMNGWFMHDSSNGYDWPPPPSMIPVFTSFHVHRSALLDIPGALDFLRKHGPIGCRDMATLRLMKHRSIPATFTGCLTTTLCLMFDKTVANPDSPIYRVDAKYVNIQGPVCDIKHLGYNTNDPLIYEKALKLLGMYSKASKIITSRLHCALPSASFGTDVT